MTFESVKLPFKLLGKYSKINANRLFIFIGMLEKPFK